MINAILETLKTMGWLGIVFMILIITNTISGTLVNVWSGDEKFSSKKMLQGILKAVVFFISAVCISIAFTMLPFMNEMITSATDETLLSEDVLETLSSVGILSVVVSSIGVQGRKALLNIVKLANLSTDISQESISLEDENNNE